MKRPLFCELCPFAYKLSAEKERNYNPQFFFSAEEYICNPQLFFKQQEQLFSKAAFFFELFQFPEKERNYCPRS